MSETNQQRVGSGCRGRRPGFTLVELLVGVAIVLVLAALVLILTRTARAKANEVKAISALRQVAAINLSYATENQGEINTVRWNSHPKEGTPWVSNTFWGRFQPYLFVDITTTNQMRLRDQMRPRIAGIFSSSDVNTMAGTVVSGARIYKDGSGLPIPFAFNTYLFEKSKDVVRMQGIDNPSQVLYATYGSYFFDEEDGRSYEPMPRDASKPKNNIYYLDRERAIAAFLDGRVAILNPPFPDRFFQ